ncbi:MAG TPA: glutamine synthetase family protein [Balneolaceae bacterium]|nr:glutamine synthetase family protein [Balneolaceae bacterium]
MTTEDIVRAIKEYDGNKVKFAVTDIDGVLRGKIISKSKFLKSAEHGLGFCNVVFGWDINDAVYDNSEVTGWHTGYPDAEATIDLSTFRRIPWDKNIPFFLGDFRKSKEISGICPRTLLRKIRRECVELGYKPAFASEFEWFNFRETPQSLKEKKYWDPSPLTPGRFGYSVLRSSQNADYFNDIYDLMDDFDVPIEGLHTETGDGVYEACIEYTDVLEAADRAACFKTGVKEIAYNYDIIASFMAKWNIDLPGCGGHIHQSLWNESGNRNLFWDDSGHHQMSTLMEHYTAGILHCLPYILPMYAPTVNSYKRLVEGSWASTSVSWGVDNRTTAVRIINSSAPSMRLEMRAPGADANPYLAMAASLASGLYGIKHELSLETPETDGNEYENKQTNSLPDTLKEAINVMKSSDLPKKLFGKSFVDHFVRTREWESRQFAKQVTNWELKRYFEIV